MGCSASGERPVFAGYGDGLHHAAGQSGTTGGQRAASPAGGPSTAGAAVSDVGVRHLQYHWASRRADTRLRSVHRDGQGATLTERAADLSFVSCASLTKGYAAS